VGVAAVAAVASTSAASSTAKRGNAGIVVGNENDLRVTDYEFNDAGTGYRDVWSAAKIEAFLQKNSPVFASTEAVPGNVVFFGEGSELVDKGIVIDDTKPAGPSVVWTSAKMKDIMSEASSGFMLKMPTAPIGNLCTFDATGQVTDAGVKINDAGASASDVWTAAKILSVVNPASQMKLVPSAAPKTVAVFDASGQVQSSGKVIDDSASAGPSVLWTSEKTAKVVADAAATKMNLVSGASPKNWAMFDATGQLADSGVALNDAGKTAADVWSSLKIQSVVDAAAATATSSVAEAISNQAAACKAAVDAAKAANDGNTTLLTSLSDNLKTKMNLVPTAKSNNIAVFDGAGQAADSKLAFNDGGSTAADVWSAAKIAASIASAQATIDSQLATQSAQQASTNAAIQGQITSLQKQETDLASMLNTKMDLVPSAASGRVAVFNGSGQVIDAGFALDDAAAASAAVVWSSVKTMGIIDANATAQTAAVKNLTATVENTTATASGKMTLQPTAKANSLAVFNGSGQAIGSNYVVNDAGTTAADLWTAAKIASAVDSRVAYTGVPVVNDFAVWTTAASVGDSKVTFDDAKTTTSNLWSAAQTKAYIEAELLKTYANKLWFKASLIDSPALSSTPSDVPFDVLEAGPGTTAGRKTSIVIPKAGLFQVSLSVAMTNAESAFGKYLRFTITPGVSYRMPIYGTTNSVALQQPRSGVTTVETGLSTVYWFFLNRFSAGTVLKVTLHIVNGDGTPAVGSTALGFPTSTVANMFTVQEL